MRFMLGSAATLQIHFIDSIASADVESDARRFDAQAVKHNVMDIGNATNRRSDQP
jgi:hypothetical protein